MQFNPSIQLLESIRTVCSYFNQKFRI